MAAIPAGWLRSRTAFEYVGTVIHDLAAASGTVGPAGVRVVHGADRSAGFASRTSPVVPVLASERSASATLFQAAAILQPVSAGRDRSSALQSMRIPLEHGSA
jgi:hypothetical protein